MIEMSMKVIDYPVITVDSGNFILKSIRNAQHIDQLKRCFDRFDAFWRYHAVSCLHLLLKMNVFDVWDSKTICFEAVRLIRWVITDWKEIYLVCVSLGWGL